MNINDIGLEGFKVIDIAESEDNITVRIEQEHEFRACTECGSVRCISTGKKNRHFRDIEYKGKFCGIEIVATRYKCQDCGNTCYPQTDILQDGFRMTKRLYNQVCEECFRMPFTNVANMHTF